MPIFHFHFPSIFFKLKKKYYLKGTTAEGEMERQRSSIFWLIRPNDCNSWGWTRSQELLGVRPGWQELKYLSHHAVPLRRIRRVRLKGEELGLELALQHRS